MSGQHGERPGMEVRPTDAGDSRWIDEMLNEHWGSIVMVSRGVLHDVTAQLGLVAAQDGEPVGLLTYNIVGDECEITLMQSKHEGIGAGSALIDAVKRIAVTSGCRRLWLITTNDNLHALGFYQTEARFRARCGVSQRPRAIEAAQAADPYDWDGRDTVA